MDKTIEGRCVGNVKKLKEIFESKEKSNAISTYVTDTEPNNGDTKSSASLPSSSERNAKKKEIGRSNRKTSDLSCSSDYYSATSDIRETDVESISEHWSLEEGNETLIKLLDNGKKTNIYVRGSHSTQVNMQCGKNNEMVIGTEKDIEDINQLTITIIENNNETITNTDDEFCYRCAKSVLDEKNIVIIKGQNGGRKTKFGRRFFASISENFESKFFIGSVQDFVKLKVFDINKKQLLFIEDIFGRFTDCSYRFDEWMPYLDFLSECIKKGNTKVIITTTHEVHSAYIGLFKGSMDIFGDEYIIDLGCRDSKPITNDDVTKTKISLKKKCPVREECGSSSSNYVDTTSCVCQDVSMKCPAQLRFKRIILSFAKQGDFKNLEQILPDHLNTIDYETKQQIHQYVTKHMERYTKDGKHIIRLLSEN